MLWHGIIPASCDPRLLVIVALSAAFCLSDSFLFCFVLSFKLATHIQAQTAECGANSRLHIYYSGGHHVFVFFQPAQKGYINQQPNLDVLHTV